MRTLFPEIRPYQTEHLAVDSRHQLYLESSGTLGTIPVLVLADGPGVASDPRLRRLFDPERYHIIQFDPRGTGQSVSNGRTEDTSTSALLADLEVIRNHLSINRWLLFGTGFGALLAVLYAQQHPQNVCGMILQGVFLGRKQDVSWLYGGGAGQFFPDQWRHFNEAVNDQPGSGLIERYQKAMASPNELARLTAAREWARWHLTLASMRPHKFDEHSGAQTHFAQAMTRIGSYFLLNQFFIEENHLLQHSAKLVDIPGYIIHGRYDMTCPPEQAWALADVWPGAELDLVRDGGHSPFDDAITDALLRSTQRMARRLGVPESEA